MGDETPVSTPLILLKNEVNSLNLLKYFLINNIHMNEGTIACLISSGSEECIEFAVSKGISFDNTINNAIKYHHNEIAKCLFETYK